MAYSKQRSHCKKYLPLLKLVTLEPELQDWCKRNGEGHNGLITVAYLEMLEDAYEHGLAISDYGAVLENIGHDYIWGLKVSDPQVVLELNAKEILACITCHYRCDHFCPDDFLNESVGSGRLYTLYEAFLKKTK